MATLLLGSGSAAYTSTKSCPTLATIINNGGTNNDGAKVGDAKYSRFAMIAEAEVLLSIPTKCCPTQARM